MTDEEFYDYRKTGFSMFLVPVLLPAIVILCTFFGYLNYKLIIFECVLLVFNFYGFLKVNWYLRKHKRFITTKQYWFQTISYFAMILFAIISAFFVHEEVYSDRTEIQYYDYNVFIQGFAIIYSFVVLTFMIITAKKISILVKPKYDEIMDRDIDDNDQEN